MRKATSRPQSPTVTGFAAVTRSEVSTATGKPTGRSIRSGNDTMVTASVTAAKTNPTGMPIAIIVQPPRVPKMSPAKAATEVGRAGPSVAW